MSNNDVIAGLRFNVQEVTGYCAGKTARLVSAAEVVNTFTTPNPKQKENGPPEADLQWATVAFDEPHRSPAIYPVAKIQAWLANPLPVTPR